jgi:hypothetical protein
MFTPDPDFSIRVPDPGSWVKKTLDPGSATMNYQYHSTEVFLAQKLLISSRKYDRGCLSQIPYLGSQIRIFSIPDPGAKKAQDPGSATLHLFSSVFLLTGLNLGLYRLSGDEFSLSYRLRVPWHWLRGSPHSANWC